MDLVPVHSRLDDPGDRRDRHAATRAVRGRSSPRLVPSLPQRPRPQPAGRARRPASAASARSRAGRRRSRRTSSTPPIVDEDVGDAVHDALERGLGDVRRRGRERETVDQPAPVRVPAERSLAAEERQERQPVRGRRFAVAARAASGRARRRGCRRPRAHRPGRSGARRGDRERARAAPPPPRRRTRRASPQTYRP